MDNFDVMQAQIIALKAVVIALYSLNDDRPLLENRANDILQKLTSTQPDDEAPKVALHKLLEELQSLGYPS